MAKKTRQLSQEEKKKIFYKKIKVKPDTNKDVITNKTLEYIKKGKNLQYLYLDEEQLKDPLFLSTIFGINADIAKYYKPSADLQANSFFMTVYTRSLLSQTSGNIEDQRNAILNILFDCPEAFKNVEYIKKLIELYPHINIINVIEQVGLTTNNLVFLNKDNYETFINILNNLPLDLICKQANIFGKEVLIKFDTSNPNYLTIAKEAIKHDGFTSLDEIHPMYVCEHTELVEDALEKEDAVALYKYLNRLIDKTIIETRGKDHYDSAVYAYCKLFKNPKINEALLSEFGEKAESEIVVEK